MRDKHYTDEELIERLYGLGPNDGHLDRCSHCSKRWNAMVARKAAATGAEPYITPGFLAEQRHAVSSRIEGGTRPRILWRAASACAGVTVLVVGLMVYQPGEKPKSELAASVTVTDAQLYADISAVAETPEPLAATPIRGLFDEQAKEVVQ